MQVQPEDKRIILDSLPWVKEGKRDSTTPSVFENRWAAYAKRCGRRKLCQQLYTRNNFKKLLKEIEITLAVTINSNANDLLQEAGMEHVGVLLEAAEVACEHDGRDFLKSSDFKLASLLTNINR